MQLGNYYNQKSIHLVLAYFLLNTFFFHLELLANEGAEKKTESHGAPAEAGHEASSAGGHGGAAGASTADAVYSGKQSQQWSEIQTKLAALKAKLDVQEALVKKLNSEKNHLSGEDLISKMEELKNQHAKWLALNEEYRKISSDFETKFPEKGVNEKRIYKRLDKAHAKPDTLKSKDISLSDQLDQLQSKVVSQYPQVDQAKKKQVQKKQEPLKSNQKQQVQKPKIEVQFKKSESEQKLKNESTNSDHNIETSTETVVDPITRKIILKK